MIETFPQWQKDIIEAAKIGRGPGFRETIGTTEDLSLKDVLNSARDRARDLRNKVKTENNPTLKGLFHEERKRFVILSKIAKKALELQPQAQVPPPAK